MIIINKSNRPLFLGQVPSFLFSSVCPIIKGYNHKQYTLARNNKLERKEVLSVGGLDYD